MSRLKVEYLFNCVFVFRLKLGVEFFDLFSSNRNSNLRYSFIEVNFFDLVLLDLVASIFCPLACNAVYDLLQALRSSASPLIIMIILKFYLCDPSYSDPPPLKITTKLVKIFSFAFWLIMWYLFGLSSF